MPDQQTKRWQARSTRNMAQWAFPVTYRHETAPEVPSGLLTLGALKDAIMQKEGSKGRGLCNFLVFAGPAESAAFIVLDPQGRIGAGANFTIWAFRGNLDRFKFSRNPWRPHCSGDGSACRAILPILRPFFDSLDDVR